MLVAAPGTSLAVTEFGTGPPMVLVHGGTGTGQFDWGPVIPRLAEHHRVVVFDLRGHGGSAAPGWRIGIVRYGLDAHHVMRALGIPRALLIGFSAGANSLITLLIRRPELAVGLVTVGASVSSDPARVHEILSGPWPADLRAIDHVHAEGPDHWQQLRAALAHDWAENNIFTDDVLRRISCPVLVAHGARDSIVFPEQAERLARAVPDGRVWMAPDSGHLVQKESPAAFVEQVLEFASRLTW